MADEVVVQSAYAGAPVVQTVPTNLLFPGVMSDTSSAPNCFINQRFSNKLQAFLISYADSVAGDYSVYGV